MKFLCGLCFMLGLSQAWGHARLTYPTPRSTNAGIKTGPCGGLPKGAAISFQAGQQITVQWQETVNHPGKYIFSLSMANDTNFNQNVLATVVDSKNTTGDLPHTYSQVIQLPNVNCDTCTLQMIQSMEENPASPSYYYSCADIKLINASGGGGTNTPLNSQGANSNAVKFGGGCATISATSKNNSRPPSGSVFLLAPLALAFMLIAQRRFRLSRSN